MPSYIILSLKHSKNDCPIFWRADNAGYTFIPWAAGIYTQGQVQSDPDYYNDGYNSIAIPLTESGIEASGLEFKLNISTVKKFYTDKKKKPKKGVMHA